jgi:hypothetical protein
MADAIVELVVEDEEETGSPSHTQILLARLLLVLQIVRGGIDLVLVSAA